MARLRLRRGPASRVESGCIDAPARGDGGRRATEGKGQAEAQMCGIVGYVGSRPCRDLLLRGLEKLEYRGYDSAGLALVGDGDVELVHAVGNLAHLREAVADRDATR